MNADQIENSKKRKNAKKFVNGVKRKKAQITASQNLKASSLNLSMAASVIEITEPVIVSGRATQAELDAANRVKLQEAQCKRMIEQEALLPSSNTLYRANLQRRTYPDSFLRPPFEQPACKNSREPLEFMILSMDTCNSKSSVWDLDEKYAKSNFQEIERRSFWSFYVRLYGVDAAGHSVCCYVANWVPYLYVQIPPAWYREDVDDWIDSIDKEQIPRFKMAIKEVDMCQRVNMYGYTKRTGIPVVKISFANKKMRQNLIDLLNVELLNPDAPVEQRQFRANYRYDAAPGFIFWPWDVSVSPKQQFVNSSDIKPSCWVRIKRYSFHNEHDRPSAHRRSRCQIDITADYSCVEPLPEKTQVAPFLIASWDLEVMRGSQDRMLPSHRVPGDEVFQAGTSVMRFGDPYENIPLYSCVHCVKPTDNLAPENVHINEYATEKDMLQDFAVFLRDKVDADVLLTFNGEGFDNDYWERRTERHVSSAREDNTVPYSYSPFDQYGLFEYGRVRGELSRTKDSYGGSEAHGNRASTTIRMNGRIQLDLMKYAAQEWKIPRSLNFVANWVFEKASESNRSLKKEDFVKLDLPFYELHEKYTMSSHDRGQVAQYCAVDTQVPLRIAFIKQVFLAAIEFSRLTGLTIDEILNKKQTARGFAKLSKYVHEHGYMIPEWPERFVQDMRLREMMFGADNYEGAYVFPPERGFYLAPIATLDFAGLYPSIMRGFRLCYTTLILDPAFLQDPSVEYRREEIPDKSDPSKPPFVLYWCTNSDPLLYKILTDVGDARKAAKKEKSKYEGVDPFLYDLFDARQNSLKLIANSLYGFTGAKMIELSCLAIAASVTAHGREGIQQTRDYVEANEPTAHVIYGDTDSVMIKFPDDTSLEYAFTRAKQLAAEVTRLFPKEVSLEFEKVFKPSAFYIKKNYAGLKYTDLNKKPEYAVKGLAPVRGDKIPFVKNLSNTVLKTLLYDSDANLAVERIKEALEDMLSGRVDASEFVQEKKLAKMPDEYPENCVHAKVAREMGRRDPSAAPKAGEIIPFFVVQGNKKGINAVDCDHFYANRNKYTLDMHYYLENLVCNSIGKLIDLPGICSNVDALFAPYLARARAMSMRATRLDAFVEEIEEQNDDSEPFTSALSNYRDGE